MENGIVNVQHASARNTVSEIRSTRCTIFFSSTPRNQGIDALCTTKESMDYACQTDLLLLAPWSPLLVSTFGQWGQKKSEMMRVRVVQRMVRGARGLGSATAEKPPLNLRSRCVSGVASSAFCPTNEAAVFFALFFSSFFFPFPSLLFLPSASSVIPCRPLHTSRDSQQYFTAAVLLCSILTAVSRNHTYRYFDRTITQPKHQGASQAMLYATPEINTKEDLAKPQVGIASVWYARVKTCFIINEFFSSRHSFMLYSQSRSSVIVHV